MRAIFRFARNALAVLGLVFVYLLYMGAVQSLDRAASRAAVHTLTRGA